MTDWKKWVLRSAILIAALLAGYLGWRLLNHDELGDAFASGNGRVEATEIDIAAKTPGRIRSILADEGDEVKAGQVLATIDVDALLAQRAQAIAQRQAALTSVQTAQAQVAQALSQRIAVLAQQSQRETDLGAARKHLDRSTALASEGATPRQEEDDDRSRVQSARAGVDAARAQVGAIDAAVVTARSQLAGARASVDAGQAAIRRIEADIADAVLRAPRGGRIQYRITEPGEVVGAGGKVLNMIDLSDAYMTFFLPERAAGRVGMGDEARIVLDAMPDRVIPARISFVADVAQFTPKSVETKDERQKLMFRMRATISPKVLAELRAQVRSGMPGVAYVRIDASKPWPAKLALKP